MARTPSHQDAMVHALQEMRRFSWSRPEQFENLDTLLEHPLITERASSNETPALVAALRATLQEVVRAIAREEQQSQPDLDRSVAYAGTVLLRLEPEYERKSLAELRADVTARWRRRDGGKLSPDSFRQQLEVAKVYEPLAESFRRLAVTKRNRHAAAETSRGAGTESSKSTDALQAAMRIMKRELPQPSRISEVLLDLEAKTLERRVAGLRREGRLIVRDQDEMSRILLELTKLAKHDCRAVDSVPAGEWFSSLKLNNYLKDQLDRVAHERIELERIRIISDEELQGGRSWEQLAELIDLHERAGATLLLCRKNVLEKLRLKFNTHMGLFMVDAGTDNPAAITGELSATGSIGLARVFLAHNPAVKQLEKEYENLRTAANEQDVIVRKMLPIGI